MTDADALFAKMAVFLRRRRDLTKDDEARAFADEHLGGNERLLGIAQLEIYREQFWLRHTGSLVEDFPGVGGVIGVASWNRLVEEYLVTFRPESYSLRNLGDRFPAFVGERDWLEERRLASDMARLEWAHVEVFDAEDAPPLAPNRLAAVPDDAWEGARLLLDPGLRVLAFDYPVVPLRRALLRARDAGSSEPLPLPERAPCHLAVHRRERLIHHDALEPLAFALLERVAGGAPLGTACERAAEASGITVDEIGTRVEGWFSEWARLGYIVDVETG